MKFKKLLLFALILFNLNLIGQKTISQEDEIYHSIDEFVAKPSQENLKKLEKTEADFWKNTSKKKSDFLAIVILNCNKAYYENQFGLTKKAILSYENASRIFRKNKLSDYDISENCLKPLGNLYTIIGDYQSAENTIKQYYYIASYNKNHENKIAAIVNLSNVYSSSGKNSLSIELLENTIRLEKLTSLQKGILLNNLGTNYILKNDFEKAKKTLENAVKLLKTEKNQSQYLSNSYRNLATIYAQEKSFNLANSTFELAKKTALENQNLKPREIAKLNLENAQLLFEQGKLLETTQKISLIFKILIPNYSSKNILPNQNSLFAETVLLDALDLQANVFLKQNLPEIALQSFTLSSHIEDLFSELMIYENSQIINQTRVRNRTEKCISIYEFLYQKEKKPSYLENAFLLSEESKSGVLKNYLSNKNKASKTEKSYLELLQNFNTEIIKEQQKGDLADVSKINIMIQKQNEIMLLLKNIRSKNSEITQEKLNLKSLFSKLEKQKAFMVYYFSGLEKIYSFTLKNNKITLQSIDNNFENKTKISNFLGYFSNPDAVSNNISGYNSSGKTVYDLLHLPKKSDCKNLIIIPDGILNFVPFEALITKKAVTTNFSKMNYFLNDYSISYNNSAIFYINGKPISDNKKTVLGIFPVFENTDYELTFSKKEMQSIKKNFDGKFFENEKATFDNFKKNATDYSILHLSTHGFSGDTEIPASIKFYDQEILYSELYNLKINPDLVVLSACETGIGKLYKSEGAMSIARGFQFAGAQNLLFSLWKVNDFTTSVFMENFYKNVEKNNSFSDANHQAKLDFLRDKSVSNDKKSPYYWSAFVYYGEIQPEENQKYLWVYGILILAIILLFVVWKKYRKTH